MRLEKIKYTRCPTCSSEIKDARIHNLHSYGEWNETVTFHCGAVHNYSPNFSRIIIETVCPKERRLIQLNFLLKVDIACDPGVTVGTLKVKGDGLGWYWHQQFEMPKGSQMVRSEIIKQVEVNKVK